MTAPTLKLVPDNDVDSEIAEVAGEIAVSKMALAKSNGRVADVLPPDTGRRYDDLGNAERFLDWAGEDLLYAAEAKKWLIWDKTHWSFDSTDMVFDLVTGFAKDLYSPENANSKEAMSHAIRSNNRSGLNAMMEISQRKQSMSIDQFDSPACERRINCLNGTLDLETGNLAPHDRNDRITRLVNCNYDADARSLTFERFLERIQPDSDIRAFLQRSIGYSLLGSVRERSFWILYGTGNNGKSIFTNLFNNLLGDYASTTTTASIMAGKHNAIPNDIARLKGKRFIVVPETGENERLNAALVKALSAGDKVSARFLFGEYFDFYFTGKLWIATNHKPTITDYSKGFWDRVKLIPFAQDIPADQVIKSDDLMKALMNEAPGILAWAVRGARDYFEMDGLDVPPVIQEEIDRYKFEQDSIAQFLEEHCQTLEDAKEMQPEREFKDWEFQVLNGDIYTAYENFCTNNGEKPRIHKRFTQNMRERGFTQSRTKRRRFWEGIRVVDTSTGYG